MYKYNNPLFSDSENVPPDHSSQSVTERLATKPARSELPVGD